MNHRKKISVVGTSTTDPRFFHTFSTVTGNRGTFDRLTRAAEAH
jgi:hypothetical protein